MRGPLVWPTDTTETVSSAAGPSTGPVEGGASVAAGAVGRAHANTVSPTAASWTERQILLFVIDVIGLSSSFIPDHGDLHPHGVRLAASASRRHYAVAY